MSMTEIQHPQVRAKFQAYPDRIRPKLLFLRKVIIDIASATPGVGKLEETLKWGEPSYVSRIGSTIRMDWKEKRPDHYAMYFNCNTKLVDTFRELYRGEFEFEGNRAVVFHEDASVPVDELKHCVALALTYHKVKHLPMLGV